MKVHQVTNGIKIEADNVYVIPQATYMTIADGHLALSDRSKFDKRIPVIDNFLETLAHVYQHKAIAIILSGTGSDGTAGVQAIKANGGITFAQDDTAMFQGMVRNAYESGYVDFVMSLPEIAEELASFAKQDYARFGIDNIAETNKRELKKIQAFLYSTSGVDFSQYKQSTVDRRILRRMALNRVASLENYNRFLRSTPGEADLLYRDLLISVTSFYREPAVINTLKKLVFPQLFKNRKPTDAVRIWIPACASGEEAASMAIALFEYLGEKALSTPIQIFGTDLSEGAIDKARTGSYPAAALQNLPAPLITKYFTPVETRFQIIKAVRDVCIFARHNLLKDPPFSRMDLISCQNVMIYLGASAQKKVLQAFHYALKPSSFMVLGKSEGVGNENEMFETIDKEHKIFTNKAVQVNVQFDFFSRRSRPTNLNNERVHETIPITHTEFDIEKETDRIIMSRYVPPSILVNKDLQIVRFNGSISRFLQPTSGKASLHLLKMVKDELIVELRSLINRARKEGIAVKKEVIITGDEGIDKETTIEITPIKSTTEAPYFLIVFCETAAPQILSNIKTVPVLPKDKKDKKINALGSELKEIHMHMKSMNEEFEATREELQSANEEILSTNEELQSMNEELETSKEELQSTNEELITVNEELQLSNHELQEAVDYTKGIVETIREPLIVLTKELRFKTANKAFYEIFKMKKDDVEGKNMKDIGKGMFNFSALTNQLKLIVNKGVSFQNFEVSGKFSFLGDRVLLFNAMRMNSDTENKMRILIAMQDITERKLNEQEKANLIEKLGIEQDRLNLILNNMPAGVLIVEEGGKLVFSNAAARNILGENDPQTVFELNEMMDGIPLQDKEVQIVCGNSTRFLSVNSVRIPETKTRKALVVINFINISRRKEEAEELISAQKNLNVALEAAQMGVWDLDLESGAFRRSLRYDQLMGFNSFAPEVSLEASLTNVHEEDHAVLANGFDELKKTGKMNVEVRVMHKNAIHWISVFGRSFFNTNGVAIRAAGVSFDITDRKLSDSHKDEFIAIASHELKTPITSIRSYTGLLKDMVGENNISSAQEIMPRLEAQVERLTGLVMDLLDVTKINEGQMTLHREITDINELIKKSAAEIQRTSKKHQIKLLLHPCAEVLADVNRIEQVVFNLISNAVKYSPHAASIEIETKQDNNRIIVSITDFGIGMPELTRRKVFERFFRDNNNTIPTSPGMGLGLFIASDIVKRHGGEIGVKSEQGKGSTFYFSLPVPL